MTKDQAIYNMELLLRVLRLSEERYSNLLLEEGMAYLDLYLCGDDHGKAGRDALVVMPEYWAWWRRQWDLRNQRFVLEHELESWGGATGPWERALLLRLFHELHAADRVELRVPRRTMSKAIKQLR